MAVAVFTGEGGLTSPALMLVLPPGSLCPGKDKCHVLYSGVSWLKRARSIKKFLIGDMRLFFQVFYLEYISHMSILSQIIKNSLSCGSFLRVGFPGLILY